ncbi:hypothetical protein ABK040_012212 [Willaertia magna]
MSELPNTIPLLFEQSQITEFDDTRATQINYPKDFGEKIQQFSNISEFMFIFGKTNWEETVGGVQLFNLTNFKIKKVVTGEQVCILLTEDGKCYAMGNLTNLNLSSTLSAPIVTEPTLIDWTVNDPVEDVFAHNFICFLTKNKELYFFTDYSSGSIASGKLDPKHYNYEKIKSIDLGFENILILTENNNIYGYGSNYTGQLGFPFDNLSQFKKADTSYIKSKIIKVFCTYNTSIILTEDGKCYACGDPTYAANGQLQPENSNIHLFKLIPNLQNEFIENVIPGLFFVALKASK